jgi:hypothetical protein
MSRAIIGLAAGSLSMIAVMLLWNYIMTPIYMGVPREAVVAMIPTLLLPFNALKACLNSAFVLILYKPLVSALRKTGLVAQKTSKGGSAKAGVYLLAGALLVSCVFLLLVLKGKI